MRKVKLDESAKLRTGSATVTIEADPLEVELDPLELGRGPAKAIARSIATGIRNSGIEASAGTRKQRQRQGVSSSSKWNATGKLADSITAERDGQGYAITAAPDRLQYDELAEKIVEDVPAIADPLTPAVDAAIEATADAMITTKRR